MQSDKPDKIQRMRDLIEEFGSAHAAAVVLRDLHHEQMRNQQMAALAPFGSMQITDWGAFKAYMNAPPETNALPLHELLDRAEAEIHAAIAREDANDLFGLAWLIAKAVKPYRLYSK